MTEDERPENWKELASWMLADFERYAYDENELRQIPLGGR